MQNYFHEIKIKYCIFAVLIKGDLYIKLTNHGFCTQSLGMALNNTKWTLYIHNLL